MYDVYRVMKRQYTILVVEDETALRDFVLELLASRGFEVLSAADGFEAIRILAERPVDLMFTDIVMPGISGFQLAQQAKLMRPALKVLYTTGYAQEEARQTVRHGRLVRKPLRATEILSEIQDALVN